MTTLYRKKIICAICGIESEFPVVTSTVTFCTSADLDTRPPEMKRSTIFTWVQRCPNCGYCESHISKSSPGSQEVTGEVEYKKQLKNNAYPELANSFICMAIIRERKGDYVGATWSLIHAAWACDDAAYLDEAKICRNKAADMLVIAEIKHEEATRQKGASTAILVDLLRRSGRFDEAKKAIKERRGEISDDIIIKILDFQAALIEKGDLSAHTISEVIGETNQAKKQFVAGMRGQRN